MNVVIDYEVLYGSGNESVVKELSVDADGVINTFLFRSPYHVSSRRHRKWSYVGRWIYKLRKFTDGRNGGGGKLR
jgi:hypothetical protein